MVEFTIAIPVYNGEKSLERTLKAVLNQEYPDSYEVVVSNNGSKDGTAAILERYKDRLRIINRPDTVPMYENHNICLTKATGRYIVYCHADDILLPNALKGYHRIIENRGFPAKYVLWGRSMFRDFYQNWKYGGTALNTILAGENAIKPFLFGGLAPSGVCYSREALLKIGGFCAANLRLTPFDMSTMFKMAIAGFEFEMSDRLFFIRRYASTAHTLNYLDLCNSISDAFLCLQKEISEDEFDYLIQVIKTSGLYTPYIYRHLVKHKHVSKFLVRMIILKRMIRNPLLLTNQDFRRQMLYFIF